MFMLMLLLVVLSMITTINAKAHWCGINYGSGGYWIRHGDNEHLPWGPSYATGTSRRSGNHYDWSSFLREKRDLLEQAGRLGKNE
jgi:hypothetical protein